MHKLIKKAVKTVSCERGVSLISTSMLIVMLGMFGVVGAKYYDIFRQSNSVNGTEEKIEYVQQALRQYLTENGRYPCPAPLNAPIDGAGFGAEVSGDCPNAGAVAGTFVTVGRAGRTVRTGAVPVRTLNISDKYMLDSHGMRMVYAVTEEYAAPGPVSGLDQDNGAISIIDSNGNDATSTPGNIVQVVYSMGGDENGAFSIDGNLISACAAGSLAEENCNFAIDATFMNTPHKSNSENAANKFVHQISYVPSQTTVTCQPPGAGGNLPPKDIAFLVDTSGSMGWDGVCPSTMGSDCSRIDVARWAMRRVVPARIYNNTLIGDDAGSTSMTGFVGYNNTGNVTSNLGNITFDDPEGAGYTTPTEDALNAALEAELQGMCPSGSTPLGIHIEALAARVGNGTPDRPNKIMILSDGANTNGADPFSVVSSAAFQTNYPNVQVDIIDVVGNPSLEQVAQATGGSYYLTSNPDELLDSLFNSAGTCAASAPPTPPADVPGCGSSGNWWNNN